MGGHLIEYKRAQGMVRKSIRKAKREYWRKFCDSLGRTTPIEKVWGMIRKMKGNGREYGYPVLTIGGDSITSSKEKAEIIGKTLAKVHSSENLSYEEKKGREETISKYQFVFENGDGESDSLNVVVNRQVATPPAPHSCSELCAEPPKSIRGNTLQLRTPHKATQEQTSLLSYC